MALFETKNLTFSYPLSDKTALKNVDLKVEQGEFILVMGKSGSGKSTLLRLLKKEIAPVGEIGGEININCDSIGFVGQNPETSFVCDNVRSELAFALENDTLEYDLFEIYYELNISHDDTTWLTLIKTLLAPSILQAQEIEDLRY